jgi:hypothetical protein
MPISISIDFEISIQRTHGAHMKHSRLKATLTDPHLWIPLVILAIGIGLLATLA